MERPDPSVRMLRVRGRGLVPVPAIDFHDADPPPWWWRLRGWRRDGTREGDEPTVDDATRTMRANTWSGAGMTPKQLTRHRRNLAILVAHKAGSSERMLADAFDLSRAAIHKIINAYETKYGKPGPAREEE